MINVSKPADLVGAGLHVEFWDGSDCVFCGDRKLRLRDGKAPFWVCLLLDGDQALISEFESLVHSALERGL